MSDLQQSWIEQLNGRARQYQDEGMDSYGAVALGHPLGCTGARIVTTLVHEMRRRAPEERRPYFGLATLCVGVGQGEATIVEWIGDWT